MSLPYPSGIPISEIQAIVATVRGGTVVADRAKLGKEIWVVEGYLLGQALGEPGGAMASAIGQGQYPMATAGAPLPDLTDEAACSHLEALIGAEDEGAPHQFTALGPIPWVPILKWLLTFAVGLL